MTRKKPDKKMPQLEPQFHDILVCKKNNFRPFLEILIEEPENISRQNLGILIGIFQIDDYSEDSSYVVNYLISIIKKEYFSRANRGPVENFEAALHKANLALAKLAAHENIGWIGKINAICAVIEKNNLLLSQTGSASVFLLRGATMTEITEMPDESIDSNPLKTFQDVISGKIEKNDKLLFATKEIFDIFSLEELKKSALKFSRQNFIQFLNTALVNELDQAAVLVVDIDEKIEELAETPHAKRVEDMNVFSQTAFRKESSPQMLEKERIKEEAANKERQSIIQELKGENKDFVDKKTGHIYIKEPQALMSENPAEKQTIDFSPFLEKLSDFTALSKKTLTRAKNALKDASISLWQKSAAKITELRQKQKAATLEKAATKTATSFETEIKTASVLPKESKIPVAEKVKTAYAKLEITTRAEVFLKKIKPRLDWLKDEMADGVILILRKPTQLAIKSTNFLKNIWQNYKTEKSARNATHSVAGGPARPSATDAFQNNNVTTSSKRSIAGEPTAPASPATKDTFQEDSDTVTSDEPSASDEPTGVVYPWEKSSSTHPESKPTKPLNRFLEKTTEFGRTIEPKKILPDFSRLKQITGRFDQKQKISALVILFLLLVVPYFIVKWENKPKEKPPVVEETPVIVLPLENDVAVTRVEKLDKVYAGNVTKLLNLNNKFFALTDAKIIDLENKREFLFSGDFQNPDLFFGMEDLNLIFLVKDNKIISLSPTTGKFQNNNLDFPTSGKIASAGAYLTYIYLLDASGNQIYRAPRAEGGFGEKTAWLKDTIDLSSAKDLAINENIFVLSDQAILKLFRGKKLDFSLAATATPIAPDKLYAKNTGTNLYVLDKTNARIVKLDSDGKILAQYYNTDIKNATDFSVSEDNNLIYISDASGVKSFGINQ
ncbi:MAG: hypothetical protein NTY33_00945 [Candidatus Moranbacteria bacterium]|nr:hypothetical protein [Candidatus Moranbacteria bacterium]